MELVQTAVEALKAKGGMGARRRGNSSKTVPSEDTPTTGESEKKITGNSFADLLSSISDYLFHLLRDVEKLQSFTEKVSH